MSVVENQEPRTANRELPTTRASLVTRYWSLVTWALPLLALFGLALFIRFYRLGAQPLWLDEGSTWAKVTRNQIGLLLRDLVSPTEGYPLFRLLLKVDTRLLGDGEWALRLPSALAGAFAVPAIFALGRELRGSITGLGAALLLLLSPFAIWQAQDANAYSLTLLVTILLALTLSRAIRLHTRRSWLLFAVVALIALFTHRLLVFALLGCVVAWVACCAGRWRRWMLVAVALVGLALAAAMVVVFKRQNAGAQYAQVGLLDAAWWTFNQFAIGQGPGIVRKLWLLPFGLLTLIGGVLLLRDALQRRVRGAMIVLALALVPLVLFAILLLVPIFEARYLTIVLPFWLLTLAWALPESSRAIMDRAAGSRWQARIVRLGSWFLVLGSLIVSIWAVRLPGRGIFSGAVVKEDYRDAIRELAQRVHPDDRIIVYPDAVLALFQYYAPRVSDQPWPEVTVYGQLGRAQGFNRKEWENRLFADLKDVKRAWLLIAPAHAALLDPPTPGDLLGLVGLAFQYGDQNGRLQCGVPLPNTRAYAGYLGVLLYCNNMPTVNGTIPQPAVKLPAQFGDDLKLRGYTITPFATGIRSGGTLPITIFWQSTRSLAGTNYRMFVHLTRADNPKPVAQEVDAPPLEGGLPTDRWTTPGMQIHDERTIRLVDKDGQPIPPGRYVIWTGVYRAEDGQRLPISGTTQPVASDKLLLGEVEVLPR